MAGKFGSTNDLDFKMLFESLPGLYLVIAPDADYTVLGGSKEYFDAMGLKQENEVGRPLFKVFPPNPDDPTGSANSLIDHSLKNVLKNKTKDVMEIVKYDVPVPGKEGLSTHYWLAFNSPVLNSKNEVVYIIHKAEDITASVQTEKKSADMIKLALAELEEKSLFIKHNQGRINKILDILLKYTLLDFSEELDVTDEGDELDAITVGLNTLREELQSHIKRLESSTLQLSAVNKELEAFSYSVSHDLRSPLRAIDGYSRILEEDCKELLDEEGKRLLGVIQYNAKRMGTLIDDLLAFSRLGRKDIQRSDINMQDLIEGALNEIKKAMPHKAEVKFGTLHPVKADYALISQVMINFISNAIKYSSKNEKPLIEIASTIKDGDIIYSIADNGVGFNMDYAHKLFGVFQRLHTIDEFEGTGVGLAIVQRVIYKHNGKVWAESVLGKGATFYFSIPQ
ncbi:MAG: ATP-binding protein [Bacteroidia bacterium]